MAQLPQDIINLLIRLGFTNYEARTYLGLLWHAPATGYEISHKANVPRSVVYAVLRRLEARGIVLQIHGKPSRYLPLPPQQLIAKIQSEFSNQISNLKESLELFGSKVKNEAFWNIRGYEALISTCNMLIKEAQSSVYISGWRREIELLRSSILGAKKRKLDIVIFSFNEIDPNLGEIFCYGIDEEKLEQYWDHKLILITDKSNLIMGSANQREDEQAIWTQNRAVLTIALNYIILDITLFGQRMNREITPTVVRLQSEHYDEINELIKEAISKNRVPSK